MKFLTVFTGGVAFGAILVAMCAEVDRLLGLRKQRRLAMRYLHRTMPSAPTTVTFAPTFLAPDNPADLAAMARVFESVYPNARRRRKPPANEP